MPSSPTSSQLRWLVPVLIVVVSLTVGGGLLARELYQARAEGEDAVVPTRPVTTSLSPQEQPGPSRVELTADAAAHPRAEPVRSVLQTYFDAINARDYDSWTSTVVTERVQAQPREEWLTNYQSTKDGSIVVYRIEAAPQERLNVLLGLTSTQDIADAPTDLPERCIRWHLTFPLVQESGEWKIDTLPAGTTPELSPC